MLKDPDGRNPILIGAIVGGLVGGIIAVANDGDWKDILTGVASGAASGAIIGSGAWLIEALKVGVTGALGITATAGGISGGVSSLIFQSSEFFQGKREAINGEELTTDMLIGVPVALAGGAISNAASGQLKKFAGNLLNKHIQNTATREYRRLIENTLKQQYPGLSKRQISDIADKTIKTIQKGGKEEIEMVRVSLQSGVVVGTEAISQISSNKLDDVVGED